MVGASATASLLVGGLIFVLAKRSRASKKISKLQLSDDAEDRGKLHEEYKVSPFSNFHCLFFTKTPKTESGSDFNRHHKSDRLFQNSLHDQINKKRTNEQNVQKSKLTKCSNTNE